MIRPIDNNSSPIIYINTINNAFFHLSIIFMLIWIFLQRLLLLTRSMPIYLRMESHRYVIRSSNKQNQDPLSFLSLSPSSIKKRKNPNATKMMISFNNNKSGASKHSNRRAGTATASAAATTIAFVISVVVITISATSSSIGVVTARRDRRDDRGSIRGSYQRPRL